MLVRGGWRRERLKVQRVRERDLKHSQESTHRFMREREREREFKRSQEITHRSMCVCERERETEAQPRKYT